jgi:hypothetical protein
MEKYIIKTATIDVPYEDEFGDSKVFVGVDIEGYFCAEFDEDGPYIYLLFIVFSNPNAYTVEQCEIIEDYLLDYKRELTEEFI